jgi:hypothetical protein
MKRVVASAAIAVLLAIATADGTTINAGHAMGVEAPPLAPFGTVLAGAALLLLWLRRARVDQ